jgi:prophage antirepressor-like protein
MAADSSTQGFQHDFNRVIHNKYNSAGFRRLQGGTHLTRTNNTKEPNQLVLMGNTDFSDVRIITIDGQPWFVGKDVCHLFGDKNHNRSLSRVDDEDKQTVTLDTKGGRQRMTAVNESGLYSLLLDMRPQRANNNGVPDAYPPDTQERLEKLKVFRRWVTHEVLPCVRERGRYTTPAEQRRIDEYIDQLIEEYEQEKNIVYVYEEDENKTSREYWESQQFPNRNDELAEQLLEEYHREMRNRGDYI